MLIISEFHRTQKHESKYKYANFLFWIDKFRDDLQIKQLIEHYSLINFCQQFSDIIIMANSLLHFLLKLKNKYKGDSLIRLQFNLFIKTPELWNVV